MQPISGHFHYTSKSIYSTAQKLCYTRWMWWKGLSCKCKNHCVLICLYRLTLSCVCCVCLGVKAVVWGVWPGTRIWHANSGRWREDRGHSAGALCVSMTSAYASALILMLALNIIVQVNAGSQRSNWKHIYTIPHLHIHILHSYIWLRNKLLVVHI